MIPYVDLPAQNRGIEEELVGALRGVVHDGHLILGAEVERFEERIAAMHRAPGQAIESNVWAIGVSSGTDALALALEALGIGPGDEVVTVPNTFVATVAAVVRRGAIPVFVDVDEHQLLDPGQLPGALTGRTKAIIPVHLNGRPADMTAIMEIARGAGVPVVEDAAQAIGASWAGQPVGAFGELGCYSMHPLKNLGALGEAGIIVGRSQAHRDALWLLRNHGLRDRDTCERWGHNARLHALQAAFLNVKLDWLSGWTERRRAIAEIYLTELAGLPLELPSLRGSEQPVWSGFVIRCDDRDDLRDALARAGVTTLIYYPAPVHLQPAASALGYRDGDFPVAERQARRMLSLPVHADLSDRDVRHVVESVRRYYRSSRACRPPALPSSAAFTGGIRPMVRGDLPVVVDIVVANDSELRAVAAEEIGGAFPDAPGQDAVGSYLVAELEGAVVGVVGWVPDHFQVPDIRWLAWGYVRPEYQRRGVGAALFDAAEERLVQLGVRKIYLDVGNAAEHESAIAFHTKRGYTLEGSLPDFWADGDDLLIFGKHIGSRQRGGYRPLSGR